MQNALPPKVTTMGLHLAYNNRGHFIGFVGRRPPGCFGVKAKDTLWAAVRQALKGLP